MQASLEEAKMAHLGNERSAAGSLSQLANRGVRISAFKRFDLDLPEGAIIYGDKAYTDYEYEDFLGFVENLVSHVFRSALGQGRGQVGG
jgi:hypothetical protein